MAGLGLMLCCFVLMFVIVSFITGLLMSKMTSNVGGAVRIAILLQDLFVFMLPAIVTAIMMTRLPARFLYIDVAPRIWVTLLAIATLFSSMPWMNWLISWNEGITFPESMKGVESMLRASEKEAGRMVDIILEGASFGSLIVSVCIVGVLAGLSEELFFRGALLRLFNQMRMNPQVAIWIVAIIFSVMHFQFFGFFPRMLLGAFFGYLVWWTRSLWVPIIVHMVNNSVVVVSRWIEKKDGIESMVNTVGTGSDNWSLILLSLLLTAFGLYLIYRNSRIRT